MKGIESTGAPLVHVPGWMGGWVDGWVGGWVGVNAVLRIAYSNQKFVCLKFPVYTKTGFFSVFADGRIKPWTECGNAVTIQLKDIQVAHSLELNRQVCFKIRIKYLYR
jgi:hypothetical protein